MRDQSFIYFAPC